jgi:DNA polymerase V
LEILMDWERIIDTAERIIVNGGGNKSDLAKILEVRPQYLSDIRSGKSKNPGSDFTLALINKLGFSSEWIETGQGEVLQPKLKIKDAVLLAKYGPILEEIEKITSLNSMEHDRFESRLSIIEERLKITSDMEYPVTTENGEGYTADPEPEYGEISYRESVAAGLPISQSEDENLVVNVPLRFIKTKASDYYVLRIRGNSMIDANIPDGSLVLIRKSDVPQHDIIQVVRIDGRATLKRMKEGENHNWLICYEDGSGRTIPLGEENLVQGDFVVTLPPLSRPRMRGE